MVISFSVARVTALIVATMLVATGCGGAPSASPSTAPSAIATAARPSTPTEIFLYTGANRQQILEEGARAEGKLTFYTAMTLDTRARPLADAFQKKYPFITVEVVRLNPGDITQRASQEFQAGRNLMDVVESSFDTVSFLKPTGVLAKYTSPELSSIPSSVKDPDGFFVADRENPLVFTFNTSAVPASGAPKTWDDLLDPKWKGKLATNDTTLAVAFMGAMLKIKGEAYVRKLAEQNVTVYSASSDAVIGFVSSGQAVSSFPASLGNILSFQKQGQPLGWSGLDQTPTGAGYVGVGAKAPHPFAAALFVDFLFSESGQQLMSTTGEGATRTGIKNAYADFNLTKFYTDFSVPQAQYATEFKNWQTLHAQLFTNKK